MDPSPVLALLLAFGLILGGNAMEGGHISSLIQPTAGMIVLGGTIGATWLSATNAELKLLMKMMPRIVKPGLVNRPQLRDEMIKVANLVRRDGMLSVESMLASLSDPMLRKGLQMLVDGSAIEDVREVIETETDIEEHHNTQAAKLFETAGGFAPTVGILGAVLGLIHVMQNLSDPSKLGSGIAVAFVATIYGVGSANLIFLPIGGRLKKIIALDAETRSMVMAGLAGIAAGANSRQLAELLSPWMGHEKAHAPAAGGSSESEAA